MQNFKVLKIVPDVNGCCEIALKMFCGLQDAFLMMLGDSKLVSKKYSKFETRVENAFSACEAEFQL